MNIQNNKKGLFIAISGPSGVGKGTIINLLKERFKEATYVLSNTTRALRAGEKEGEQYYFTSVADFEQGIKEGRFLEWAQVHHQDYYGILKEPVMQALANGQIVLREVDLQGARLIQKEIPADQMVSIFILPENMEILRLHILQRGLLAEEEIQRRLESAKIEVSAAGEFNYQVINHENRVEDCFSEIMALIFKEAEQRGLM